jgi:putative Mg2+ transporter-C (MgtC) family protein
MVFWDFFMRLMLALALGSLIGLERQWRQRTAGLRTNTLVSIGSALFVILSAYFTHDASPSRIASQIVSGIGFLGAGVIMKEGLNVKGLNTAATLWCSAAIGSLSGMGLWVEASWGTVAILAAHFFLRPFGHKIDNRPEAKTAPANYLFQVFCQRDYEPNVRMFLLQTISNNQMLQLRRLKRTEKRKKGLTKLTASLYTYGNVEHLMEQIVSLISLERGVISVQWEIIERDED